MQILENGSFKVEKGELFPFICPKCAMPIVYDAKMAMVKCTRCMHSGFADEFTKTGMVFKKTQDMNMSLPLRFALWCKWVYIDKQTNKLGLWLRLTLYPIAYPIVRLLLWATSK